MLRDAKGLEEEGSYSEARLMIDEIEREAKAKFERTKSGSHFKSILDVSVFKVRHLLNSPLSNNQEAFDFACHIAENHHQSLKYEKFIQALLDSCYQSNNYRPGFNYTKSFLEQNSINNRFYLLHKKAAFVRYLPEYGLSEEKKILQDLESQYSKHPGLWRIQVRISEILLEQGNSSQNRTELLRDALNKLDENIDRFETSHLIKTKSFEYLSIIIYKIRMILKSPELDNEDAFTLAVKTTDIVNTNSHTKFCIAYIDTCIDTKRYKEGLAFIENCLTIEGIDHFELELKKAYLLTSLDSNEECTEFNYLSELVKKYHHHHQLWRVELRLMDLKMQKGVGAEALKNELIGSYANYATEYVYLKLLARLYLILNDSQNLFQTCHQLESHNPKEASKIKGQYYKKQGQFESAAKEYLPYLYLDNFEACDKYFLLYYALTINKEQRDEILMYLINQGNIQALEHYIRCLGDSIENEKGADDKSIEKFIELIQTYSNTVHIDLKLTMAYYLDRINDYLSTNAAISNGGTHQSKQLLKTILQDHPNCRKAHVMLGTIYEKLGKEKKAIQLWKKVAQDTPKACLKLGLLFSKQGNVTEEVKYYQLAIKLNPGYAEAHSALGHYHWEKGNKKMAENHFNLAYKLKPQKYEKYVQHSKQKISLLQENSASKESWNPSFFVVEENKNDKEKQEFERLKEIIEGLIEKRDDCIKQKTFKQNISIEEMYKSKEAMDEKFQQAFEEIYKSKQAMDEKLQQALNFAMRSEYKKGIESLKQVRKNFDRFNKIYLSAIKLTKPISDQQNKSAENSKIGSTEILPIIHQSLPVEPIENQTNDSPAEPLTLINDADQLHSDVLIKFSYLSKPVFLLITLLMLFIANKWMFEEDESLELKAGMSFKHN